MCRDKSSLFRCSASRVDIKICKVARISWMTNQNLLRQPIHALHSVTVHAYLQGTAVKRTLCTVCRSMKAGFDTAMYSFHDPASAMHHLIMSSYMILQVMPITCNPWSPCTQNRAQFGGPSMSAVASALDWHVLVSCLSNSAYDSHRM